MKADDPNLRLSASVCLMGQTSPRRGGHNWAYPPLCFADGVINRMAQASQIRTGQATQVGAGITRPFSRQMCPCKISRASVSVSAWIGTLIVALTILWEHRWFSPRT